MPSFPGVTAASRSLCVLFVEDDDADAYLVKKALTDNRRVGSVVRARDGQDALNMLAAGEVTPDFVIADLQMPTMGGLEFLVSLVDHGLANVPVVVLTSSSSQSDAIRSRVRGALQVLIKPDSIHELFTLLSSAIDSLCVGGEQGEDANRGRAHHYLPSMLPSDGAPKSLRRTDGLATTSTVFGRKA